MSIPLSLVLVALIIGVVIWAVRNGRFDDLERPGYAILDDDGVGSGDATPKAPAPDAERPGNHG